MSEPLTVTYILPGQEPVRLSEEDVETLTEVIADIADLKDLAPSRTAITMLEHRLRTLTNEGDELQARTYGQGAVEDLDEHRKLKRKLETLRKVEKAVSAALEWMRREVVSQQFRRYAVEAGGDQMDRERQLEATNGDAYRLMVDAQVYAQKGKWEEATAAMTGAVDQATAGMKLCKLVHGNTVSHQAGAQLALPLDSGHE